MLLASSISRSVARRHVSQRLCRFSTAMPSETQEPPSQEPLLPTRHSRHVMPPTCLDTTQLEELTAQILESRPGSLYSYQPSHEGSIWEVAANPTVQNVEFLLRGHAAQVPETLWGRWNGYAPDDEDVDTDSSTKVMQRLIQRLEKEGRLYMDLRREVKNQRTIEQGHEVTDEDQSDDMASPGPTVVMFDALLDVMAVAPSQSNLPALETILDRVLERYDQDGAEKNVNIHTVPTAVTFNAVIRAVVNTPYDPRGDDEDPIRDHCLQLGIATYDRMRFIRDRNSATYAYIIQTVAKFLPPSRTRGNVARGLWAHAVEQGAVDTNVIDAILLANTPSNGENHDKWIQEHVAGKDLSEFIMKWRRNAKLRRHNRLEDIY